MVAIAAAAELVMHAVQGTLAEIRISCSEGGTDGLAMNVYTVIVMIKTRFEACAQPWTSFLPFCQVAEGLVDACNSMECRTPPSHQSLPVTHSSAGKARCLLGEKKKTREYPVAWMIRLLGACCSV
jgi:hypothetical protein